MLPAQIWQDDCYYLNNVTGQCERKYILILALDGRDPITVAFTSRSNGLPTNPSCWHGLPRSGFYVGIIGGALQKESWIDFNSIQLLEEQDMLRHMQTNRVKQLGQTLPTQQFCQVLRCVLGHQDLIRRHARLIGDLAAQLACP